jgi:Xaa-Pro aminopeptidase
MLIASGGDEVMGMTPPGPRLLEEGDMVRTELTPQMNGYWLQICRSAVVGKASDAQRRSFDLFNEAVEAGLSVVRPGITAHEVAVAENDVFRKHGYGEYCTAKYTRVRGHGHGLHLDETPIIEGNHTVLPERAVFIVHPNTYTPIAGYHVLGDPVVVTATGYEVLIETERVLFETPQGVAA